MFFSSKEAPRSFPDVMTMKVNSDPRIPVEQRALVSLDLALKDYHAQKGSYPADLSQLVPAYFPKVPIDPQTAEPFKYRVDGDRYFIGDAGPAASAGGKTGAQRPAAADQKEIDKAEQNALIALLNAPDEDEFTYNPQGKRDPFRAYDFSPPAQVPSTDNPLEAYSYDELKVTAILKGLDEPTAIVENPKGRGYTVKIGAKVGNMGGKVVKIDADKVVVVETTVEFTGQTKNRTVEMFLR